MFRSNRISRLLRRPAMALGCALLLAACTTWEEQSSPAPGNRPVKMMRLMRTDYTTLVLENASVQGDSVVGARPKTGWRAAVALADVKKIEIQREDPAATFWMAALGVAAGFFGFMYLAVAGDAS